MTTVDTAATAPTENCAVCLDELSAPRVTCELLGTRSKPCCSHIFHKECIVDWTNTQASNKRCKSSAGRSVVKCPVCRTVYAKLRSSNDGAIVDIKDLEARGKILSKRRRQVEEEEEAEFDEDDEDDDDDDDEENEEEEEKNDGNDEEWMSEMVEMVASGVGRTRPALRVHRTPRAMALRALSSSRARFSAGRPNHAKINRGSFLTQSLTIERGNALGTQRGREEIGSLIKRAREGDNTKGNAFVPHQLQTLGQTRSLTRVNEVELHRPQAHFLSASSVTVQRPELGHRSAASVNGNDSSTPAPPRPYQDTHVRSTEHLFGRPQPCPPIPPVVVAPRRILHQRSGDGHGSSMSASCGQPSYFARPFSYPGGQTRPNVSNSTSRVSVQPIFRSVAQQQRRPSSLGTTQARKKKKLSSSLAQETLQYLNGGRC